MAKEFAKINRSSLQVLKTLNALLEDNYTMSELIEKLNQNEEESVFNNSVVSKYINTCRFLGIQIPKIHNKYFVGSMPFGMDLSNKDLNLIHMLQETAKKTFSGKLYQMFEIAISKISKYSNKYIARVEKQNLNDVFDNFEQAISEKCNVRLLFKVKASLECIPLGIVHNKGKTYFNILANDKERMIHVERVSGIEILGKTFLPYLADRSVVYKLTGGLAKRYALRENETILTQSLPEFITISNLGEPQELLLARLLRYDKCCEVLNPVEYRDLVKDVIDKTLANYGE